MAAACGGLREGFLSELLGLMYLDLFDGTSSHLEL